MLDLMGISRPISCRVPAISGYTSVPVEFNRAVCRQASFQYLHCPSECPISPVSSPAFKMNAAALEEARAQAQAQAVLLRSKLSPMLAAYIRHRPLVQRALTAGFVLYCLSTTYMSLTGRGKGAGRESSSRKVRRGMSVINPSGCIR